MRPGKSSFNTCDTTEVEFVETSRINILDNPVARARAFLPTKEPALRGVPIPKTEFYPGRHYINDYPKDSTLMSDLMAIVNKEREAYMEVMQRRRRQSRVQPLSKFNADSSGDFYQLNEFVSENYDEEFDEELDEELDKELGKMVTRSSDKKAALFNALEQYPDPEAPRDLIGTVLEPSSQPRARYVRNIDYVPSETLDLLTGKVKPKPLRRKWTIDFDETKYQRNRLILAKSTMHPMFGYLSLKQFNYVMVQAWNDYENCDLSDFFTLMRLFTQLSKHSVNNIPDMVNLHDFASFHKPVPLGYAKALEKTLKEVRDKEEAAKSEAVEIPEKRQRLI